MLAYGVEGIHEHGEVLALWTFMLPHGQVIPILVMISSH
jgi:hypothetical protein